MEGKLHAEGLEAMDGEDGLLTATAQEPVARHGEGAKARRLAFEAALGYSS
jgi:hypothetical protein